MQLKEENLVLTNKTETLKVRLILDMMEHDPVLAGENENCGGARVEPDKQAAPQGNGHRPPQEGEDTAGVPGADAGREGREARKGINYETFGQKRDQNQFGQPDQDGKRRTHINVNNKQFSGREILV